MELKTVFTKLVNLRLEGAFWRWFSSTSWSRLPGAVSRLVLTPRMGTRQLVWACLIMLVVKGAFLMFKWDFLYFSFVSVASCHFMFGTLFFTSPPIRYLYTWISFCTALPSLSRLKQSQLSQPFLVWHVLQSFKHLCGPSLDLLQYVHAYLIPVTQEVTDHCRYDLTSAE